MSFKWWPGKVVLVQIRLMVQQGNPADVLQPPLILSLDLACEVRKFLVGL